MNFFDSNPQAAEHLIPWHKFRYMMFDQPDPELLLAPYQERYRQLVNSVRSGASGILPPLSSTSSPFTAFSLLPSSPALFALTYEYHLNRTHLNLIMSLTYIHTYTYSIYRSSVRQNRGAKFVHEHEPCIICISNIYTLPPLLPILIPPPLLPGLIPPLLIFAVPSASPRWLFRPLRFSFMTSPFTLTPVEYILRHPREGRRRCYCSRPLRNLQARIFSVHLQTQGNDLYFIIQSRN